MALVDPSLLNLSPSQLAALGADNYEIMGTVNSSAGSQLIVPVSDLEQAGTENLNDLLNNTSASANQLADEEDVVPASDLAAVFTLPYDPNVADEMANVPISGSPAYSGGGGGGGINWKLWIALGVIALGLLIFKKKIGKVVDKLV